MLDESFRSYITGKSVGDKSDEPVGRCPKCRSRDVARWGTSRLKRTGLNQVYHCGSCGYAWRVPIKGVSLKPGDAVID